MIEPFCMSPQEALAAMKIAHEDEPRATAEEFEAELEALPAQIADPFEGNPGIGFALGKIYRDHLKLPVPDELKQRSGVPYEGGCFAMTEDRIKVMTGAAEHIFTTHEGCPFWRAKEPQCKLTFIECRYGLTEIRVPVECPLRATVKVEIAK